MKNGIDVSRWQGDIDWTKVREAGIEFAIIKAGGSDDGFYTDSKFEKNYKGAKEAGISVGAYYIVGSKCVSRIDGVSDANRFINIIKGKQFDYPVYIDLELTSPADMCGATDACIGFCQTMEKAGYYCGIYASDISGFVDRLDMSRLTQFDKWVARYGGKPTAVKRYGIWQKSSTGAVSGIAGKVDLNEAYEDYPSIIKAAGLNGFSKPEPVPQVKPPEKIKKTVTLIIDDHTYTGLLEEE